MLTRVAVPTPFQVGPVNAYIAGETVVDPGPDSEAAWSRLREALTDAGLAPGDVQQVLVTHPHPDHFGLASRFREAGADVVASPAAADVMADFPARLAYEQSFFEDFFVRCGMDESTALTVTQLPDAFVAYAPSVETDRAVSAGDTVTVAGQELTVDELAGHAVGELLFAFDDDGDRAAHVGDTVLPETTPNPFLQPPPTDASDRPRVLPAYNACLDRLRTAGYDRLYPGHGEAVDDPAGRIEALRSAHDERTERVFDLLDRPTTPVAVMDGLFGDLPATETFAGMSEAVGHLDVLEDAGRVTRRYTDGRFVYDRTEA